MDIDCEDSHQLKATNHFEREDDVMNTNERAYDTNLLTLGTPFKEIFI